MGRERATSSAAACGFRTRCRSLVASGAFQGAVLSLILVNAATAGLETSPWIRSAWGGTLVTIDVLIQAAFVAEIALRLAAHRPVRTFFRDGWNVFDAVVVAVSLLPAVGSLATVARVARVLRVARLLSWSPELRLIIGTMLRSIPSMGHVIALLGILLYVYGVLGYQLFHAHDPQHWGTLGTAVLSLFQVLTLEGWADMQRVAMERHAWAWVYFTSFVVVAVFVVINLFVAVVIENLAQVKAEEDEPPTAADGGLDRAELRTRLSALRAQIDALEATLEHGETR